MHASLLLRAARRQTGLGQRAFAELSGISPRSLAAAESGLSQPSWRTMRLAAEAAELSLCLVPPVAEASPELQRFLTMSTAERLYLGLGGTRSLRDSRLGPWRELGQLSTWGVMHLDGLAAVPVWVPGARAPVPLPVRLHRPRRAIPDLEHLDVTLVDEPLPRQLVVASTPVLRPFRVSDPIALSLQTGCAAHASALRTAAAHLHTDGGADAAGRRQPPHREPNERGEAEDLMNRHYDRRAVLPHPADSRTWRTETVVSLAQWLGYGRRT